MPESFTVNSFNLVSFTQKSYDAINSSWRNDKLLEIEKTGLPIFSNYLHNVTTLNEQQQC